jgi:hypothetical protein
MKSMKSALVPFTKHYWIKEPRFLAYNRLPLLANVVYDADYIGTGVTPQHNSPQHYPFSRGDIVFVKTDYLQWFLDTRYIHMPITLITGVSDLSPTPDQCRRILEHPNIERWIGPNITVSHPKIKKVLIGVGEPERVNGNYGLLKQFHTDRTPFAQKQDTICIPYHGATHASRTLAPTLPKLAYEDYIRELDKHKFVVCARGSGVDTHRFCETLLVGSVPIVEHSGLDDLYSQFPCIIVDTFDNIDTTSFVWEDAKYQAFLNMFWLLD